MFVRCGGAQHTLIASASASVMHADRSNSSLEHATSPASRPIFPSIQLVWGSETVACGARSSLDEGGWLKGAIGGLSGVDLWIR